MALNTVEEQTKNPPAEELGEMAPKKLEEVCNTPAENHETELTLSLECPGVAYSAWDRVMSECKEETLHAQLDVLVPDVTLECYESWSQQQQPFAIGLEFDELPSDDDISCNALQAGEHFKKTEKKDSSTTVKDETNSLEKLQMKKQKGGDGGRGQDKEIDKQQEQQEEEKQEELRKRSATKPKFRPTRVAADSTLSKKPQQQQQEIKATTPAANSTLSKVIDNKLEIFCMQKRTIWMTLIVFLFMTHGASGANGNDGDCEVGTDPMCPISRNIPTRAVVKGDSISIGFIPGHEIKSYNLYLSVSEATPKGLKRNNCCIIYFRGSNWTHCPELEYKKKDTDGIDIFLLSVQNALTFNLDVEGINYFANFSGVVLVSAATRTVEVSESDLVFLCFLLVIVLIGLGFVGYYKNEVQTQQQVQEEGPPLGEEDPQGTQQELCESMEALHL